MDWLGLRTEPFQPSKALLTGQNYITLSEQYDASSDERSTLDCDSIDGDKNEEECKSGQRDQIARKESE